MKSLVVVTALLAVALAAPTARGDGGEFTRSGFYVGAGASRNINFFEDALSNEPVLDQIQWSDAWGANGRVGYRVTSWFAVEAEYEWIDQMKASLGIATAKLSSQTATANFKLILPLSRFQPYFVGGIGAVFFDLNTHLLPLRIDDTALAGKLGLGMDVYLTRNFLLNIGAEGMLTNANVDLFNFHSGGLAYLTFQAGFGWRF